jgi:hypothetical protein
MTAISRENEVLGALIVTGVIAVAASGSLAWHRSSKAIPATRRISIGTDGIACEPWVRKLTAICGGCSPVSRMVREAF